MAKTPTKAEADAAPYEPTEQSAAEAAVIPAPLAAAVEETDTVFQAHLVRQANHHNELAPSIAKKAREDLEREELLKQHEEIAERNRKEREAQQAEQFAREEREGAAARIAFLKEEVANAEAALEDKKAEIARLEKLVS